MSNGMRVLRQRPMPFYKRAILRQAAETFWKLEPILQPAKILASDPGEPGGDAFALFLLLSGRYVEWILMLFPLWVLLVSIYIPIDNLRRLPQVTAISPGT